jgi:GT2 family glycosyltransferase
MTKKKPKVTLLVSNHSKAPRVVENIEYLLKQETDFDCKIFVTDVSCNEEQRGILRKGLNKYEEVELIINSVNLGYAKSHNKLKGKEVGDYVFVINPDVLFKERDTLQKVVDYMDEHPDVAILGPKQVNDTGEVAMSVRAFPKFYLQVARRTMLRRFPIISSMVAYDEMRHLDYNKTQDVDWLQSSCVIIRRDFWEEVGGYNEDYFLFMADAEMCLRAWEMGYRVVYYPKTKVYADGKRLSDGGIMQFFKSWFVRQHVIDSLRYRWNHLWPSNPRRKYYKEKGIKNNY